VAVRHERHPIPQLEKQEGKRHWIVSSQCIPLPHACERGEPAPQTIMPFAPHVLLPHRLPWNTAGPNLRSQNANGPT
jgi:hypothetical protein